LDSALWVLVARSLLSDGGHSLAGAAIGKAVECAPGDEEFMDLERQVSAGQLDNVDLQALVLGRSPLEQRGPTAI
jgi:hypothetical protein